MLLSTVGKGLEFPIFIEQEHLATGNSRQAHTLLDIDSSGNRELETIRRLLNKDTTEADLPKYEGFFALYCYEIEALQED
jgi:hypothetical protein